MELPWEGQIIQKCLYRRIRISKLLNNDKISVIIRIPAYGNTDGGFLLVFQQEVRKQTCLKHSQNHTPVASES